MESKNNSNLCVHDMQFLLKNLYIYYNYDELVEDKNNPNYFRDRLIYRKRVLDKLEIVFKGRSEKEICIILFEVLLNEFRNF